MSALNAYKALTLQFVVASDKEHEKLASVVVARRVETNSEVLVQSVGRECSGCRKAKTTSMHAQIHPIISKCELQTHGSNPHGSIIINSIMHSMESLL